MSHQPAHIMSLRSRCAVVTVLLAICGCQQQVDRFANDAPRSTDFDRVAEPTVTLFEKDEKESTFTELYSLDETDSTHRELPDFDDDADNQSSSSIEPAAPDPAPSATPEPKKRDVVQAVAKSKPKRAPIQLAVFREGDRFRQNQLIALEANRPPALSVANWINSKPLQLQQLKGRIVVLDFWATWCQPCIASVPHNNALAKKYQKDGVVLIGICHPQGAERMSAVARRAGIRYPIAADTGGLTIAAYQVDQYPDYYLIDRKGRLRLADCRNGDVEQAIQALLSEDAND